MNVVLTPEEMKKCREFSEKCAENQQSIEYGDHTTQRRGKKEIARDNLIGKIAEVAFAKLMKQKRGIDVPLDFEYYPRGKWDNQDAHINGWDIDIKATRSGGKWFLIEWNKLNFRKRENNLPHMFVIFTADWNRNTDEPTGKATYRGFVTLDKLNPDDPQTQVFRRGENLPGKTFALQTDNYGISFNDLDSSFDVLADFLLAAPPDSSLIKNFQSPEMRRR